MWTYASRKAMPLDVAREFAASAFGEPREVDSRTLNGTYRKDGLGFTGTFRLVDGEATYRIEGINGRWNVEREARRV